jgi:putative PIN family toxin of toxin-antitoxin system
MFVTAPLLAELEATLKKPKFEERIRAAGTDVARLLVVEHATTRVEPASMPSMQLRDPNDVFVVEAALGARADLLVSRDGDLLSLGSVFEISVVNAEHFRDTLGLPRPRR